VKIYTKVTNAAGFMFKYNLVEAALRPKQRVYFSWVRLPRFEKRRQQLRNRQGIKKRHYKQVMQH